MVAHNNGGLALLMLVKGECRSGQLLLLLLMLRDGVKSGETGSTGCLCSQFLLVVILHGGGRAEATRRASLVPRRGACNDGAAEWRRDGGFLL